MSNELTSNNNPNDEMVNNMGPSPTASHEAVVDEASISTEDYQKIFGMNSFGLNKDSSNYPIQDNSSFFRDESYQFKKYIITPGFKTRWTTQDLELTYISPRELAIINKYSDLIAFIEELYSLGAKKTANWFALQLYSQLALRVSIEGVGRKELNVTRSSQEMIQKEEKSGGWTSFLRRK